MWRPKNIRFCFHVMFLTSQSRLVYNRGQSFVGLPARTTWYLWVWVKTKRRLYGVKHTHKMSLGRASSALFLLPIIYCTPVFQFPWWEECFSKLQSDETQADRPAFTAVNFVTVIWFHTPEVIHCGTVWLDNHCSLSLVTSATDRTAGHARQ